MRRHRKHIPSLTLAVGVFLISLWAGPVVLPEAVKRWKACNVRAALLEAEARSTRREAYRCDARSLPDEARMTRWVARDYEKEAARYRQALRRPWEFWALGGEIRLQTVD